MVLIACFFLYLAFADETVAIAGAGEYYMEMGWAVNTMPLPPATELGLVVLDQLLMGTASAPLRKALTDSDLGASVIGYGYDSTLQQSTFTVGLKGLKTRADAYLVEALIITELTAAAEVPPEADALEAAVNTVEFELREVDKADRFGPIGLMSMLTAMKAWIYDRDPIEALRFSGPLAELKTRLQAGEPMMERLVRTHLLENQHRVTVVLSPDTGLEARRLAEEVGELAAAKAAMSQSELQAVVAHTKELQAIQAAADSAEAKATIPRLSLSDIDRVGHEIPLEVDDVGNSGMNLLWHELPTAGILYADVGLDLTVAPFESVELLPLFCRLLLETGTATHSRVALTRRIGSLTGGIKASWAVKPKVPSESFLTVPSPHAVAGLLLLRGKAVAGRAAELFELFLQVLTDANIGDGKRVVELLKEQVAKLESSIMEKGHQAANAWVSAAFSVAGRVREATAGLTALHTARRLLATAQSGCPTTGWTSLELRLLRLREVLLGSARAGGGVISLTGDTPTLAAAAGPAAAFAAGLPPPPPLAADGGDVGQADPTWSAAELVAVEPPAGIAVQTQVNYVGQAGRLWAVRRHFDCLLLTVHCLFTAFQHLSSMVQIGERVPGAAAVAASFLQNGHLWNSIRVKHCDFAGGHARGHSRL